MKAEKMKASLLFSLFKKAKATKAAAKIKKTKYLAPKIIREFCICCDYKSITNIKRLTIQYYQI